MASAFIDTSDVPLSGSSVSLEMTIQDGKGAEDNQVVAMKDTASMLDITPSRRSSRKKQSTFNSDFEYYTQTGRKVEIEVEPGSTPKSKQTGKNQKQQSDDDESDEDVGSDDDDEEGKKSVKKKTNERKQKGKGLDDDDNDSGKWKTKATKKKVKDGSVKKKQTNESSDDEDEDLSLKQFAGQKRKKVEAAVNDKRAKADESSDEEDSTPISQLKAKIKQKKLEQKKPTVISSPRQNIMQMLVEDSANLSMSSSEKLLGSGQKRKVSTGDGDTDEGPTKGLKTIKLDKLAPALANLVKQLPPLLNLGSAKQSPSKIMTNSSAPQKTSLPGNASVGKAGEILAKKLSGITEAPTTPGSKPKVHADVPSRKLSAEVDKSPKPLKPESEKTTTKGDIHPKNEKAKPLGKSVMLDPKIKGEVSHVTKVQIIRKPDGTIIKRKIIVPVRKTEAEDRSQKMKVSEFKNGDKQLSGLQKQKTAIDVQKLKVPVSSSSKNLQGQSASPLKQKTDIDRAKVEGTGHKQDQGMKNTNSNAVKKSDMLRQTVEDLLKRGIVPKKKSHQPFGNKNVVKVHGKDAKSEAGKTVSTKQEPSSNKPKINKPDSSMEVKKSKGSEKRRSSDSHKHSNGRRRSSESSKGERRKSSDSVTKKSDKQGNNQVKEAEEDGPPVLIPASAVNKVKHKHHKTEHEVPIDMTMMDLFKPDNLIAEQQKKDEATPDEKMPGSSDKVSQYTENTPDVYSFVKPENLHHILLEHMYSKPSSPVSPKLEGQQVIDSDTRRDDDIESVSHKQAVIMDVNLPDQILEESEEPVTEECVGDYQETWPDTMEELQLMVSRRDVGDRPSILESLDTELKEGGNEFRIVGQVEIERLVIPKEENVLSLQSPTKTRQVEVVKSRNAEKVIEVAKSSTDSRKSSTDSRKSSTDKRRDSADKKGHSSDRADSTSSGNDDLEKNKQKNLKSESAERTQAKEGTESEEEEEHKYEDDEKDLDWEPNDADTVYCLCRKPHNNRFMICCDRCEEWYHGTCVGVTRAKGQEMEENEEEYICPVCIKGEKLSILEKQATASKASDVPLAVIKPQKCVGRKCTRAPRPGSVYCSNECIMSHAQESLKAIREEQIRRKSSEKQNSSKDKSSSSVKTSSSSSMDTIEVIERQTGKVVAGSDAPTPKGLHRWLEQHPTFEVVQPHKHRGRSSSTKDKDVKSDKEKKHSSEKQTSSEKERKLDQAEEGKHQHDSTSNRESERRSDSERHRSSSSQKSDSSSKGEERRDDGPNQIRLSVRTALRDSLTARAQEASDIMLSGNEIKNLAVTIEEELYSMFSDTGHKYRTKYRSLVFNIKDQKNKGLFRKILTGKIKPHKLVLMSTEELASRELAKWREQASKHELEMIEKTEKEAMKERALTKHVRKKTHKGEVEVEDEDMSTLEIRLKEAQEPEPEPQEEQPQVPIVDTTDQHRAHLFDLNCKVCTGKIVPGPEEQAALKKILAPPTEPQKEPAEAVAMEEKEDFEKAEEIVKKAFQTMQKMEEAVTSMPKIVSSSPRDEEIAPPLSPKMKVSRRESSSSSSSSVSSASRKQGAARSSDSALQSGLEAKFKFIPTGPVLWKGFMSMLDVAKFFTSAYQVSGPTDYITLPDTVHILGRISPDHMWDYLSKIRQAGSKDLTVIRFIPGNDDEKIAYIHLYTYLNSRGRCGVAGNPDKQVKDFYIVPLASHSRIPRTLLPFDGPGFEENRPHMLIGILVRPRGKHGGDGSDTSSTGSSKSSTQGIVKSGSQSKTGSGKLGVQSSTGNSKSSSSTSTATKLVTPPVNRDPRLAKFSARESSPRVSPADSSSSSSSLSSNPGEVKPKLVEEYEPQYVKSTYKPVAEYIPTPTVKKKHIEREKSGPTKEDRKATDDSFGKSNKSEREKHSRHHHHIKVEKEDELEDSDPYSPGKEAEAYSPGQEAAADEPYDPADDRLIDDTGIPIVSSTTVSTPKSAAATLPSPPAAEPPKEAAVSSKPNASKVESTAFLQKDSDNSTNELVEKMARSNDPQEISSLMVVALSAVSSSHQQQLLLVELTKKVEERKLKLAEAARRVGNSANSVDNSEKSRLDFELQSSDGGSEGAGVTSGPSSASVQALNDASSNSIDIKPVVEQGLASIQPATGTTSYLATANVQPFSALGSASHSGNQSNPDSEISAPAVQQAMGTMEPKGIKFTISNTATKPQRALSLSASIFTGENLESSKSRLPFLLEDTPLPQPPVTADSGNAGKSSGASGSSGDIPDALKALMDDVMGNTQFTSLEKRRKILLQKEVKKEPADEESEIIEKQLTEQQGESQKKLISEMEIKKETEIKKDMDSFKIEQTSIDNKEGRDINTSDPGSDDSKPDPAETGVPSALTAAPSIDELLDRLKKGGFQFNVQKNESAAPSSLPPSTSSSVAPLASQPSSTTSDDIQFVESTTYSAASSAQHAASALTSLSSVTSVMDIDLRQSSGSPFPAAGPTSGSTSAVEANYSRTLSYKDYPPGVSSAAAHDQDDRTFYKDQDDRLYRPSPLSTPKHPLDPHAFPPLPGEPRNYLHPPPPPPSSAPPRPHGPLHPRFPLPPTMDQHVPYHPTPRAALLPRNRMQPMPPGMDPAGASSITNFQPDLDFRNRNRPPSLLPHQALPPLPPQSPPPLPLPPPPGIHSTHFRHLSEDMDYRSQPSHRQDYYSQGRGRSFH